MEKNVWIGYGKSFDDFGMDGLFKIGTLFEVDNEIFLIGDINSVGGMCNCCEYIFHDIFHGDKEKIVKRYKVIYEKGD